MKKTTIILLLAMVPFLTMAQKRSKKEKNNNAAAEKVFASKASYDFMIITGYEMMDEGLKEDSKEFNSPQYQVKKMIRNGGKTIVTFDFGMVISKKNPDSELLRSASEFRTMAAAVNGAAKYGWEFVSANSMNLGVSKVHYYYMRRNK